MRLTRHIPILLLLAALVPLGACDLFHRKPKVPPPQAQAPTIPEPQPQPTTPPPSQPPAPTASEPNRPQPETTPPSSTAAAPAPKPKVRHHPTTAKKPATTPPASNPPATAPAPAPATPPSTAEKPKTSVIQEGGTSAPPQGQLEANVSHDQALHQQMNTAQLLEATEANLKTVTRALTADEQAMVQHIRGYLQQSRSATAEGDLERAYNLAMKAHLLSDELVKGR